MGYGMPDPYYQPERFGLELIGSIDWDRESYEFNLTVVWIDKDGWVYWASDSGCSCPSPFENFHSVADLNKGTKWDALAYLQSRSEEARNLDVADYADLCAHVAAL